MKIMSLIIVAVIANLFMSFNSRSNLCVKQSENQQIGNEMSAPNRNDRNPQGFAYYESNYFYNDIDYNAANIINYHNETNTLSYESFNPNSYVNKNIENNRTIIRSSISQESFKTEEMTKEFLPTSEISQANLLRDIIGTDDRTLISNPKIWPFIPTAQLRMTYFNVKNNNTGNYEPVTFIGTAFFVGPNILLTAGHNVYDDVTKTKDNNNKYEDNINNPRFADMVEVYAGANGVTDINSSYLYYAICIEANIEKAYFENPDFSHDWSAIRINSNLGNITGYYGYRSNWYDVNTPISTFGYPASANYTMWEAAGSLSQNFTDYRIYYDLDTEGGQSGSPVFMIDENNKRYVVAIHTSGGQSYNGGTRINTLIFHYARSFVMYHNYEHIAATIVPTDYGYPDAYTTAYGDSNYFTSHSLVSGFEFETKRYRTGYIHNEYVVMSPIRSGIYDAFLLYHFNQQITKVEIQLTHWRELSHEWTYPSEVTCLFRVGTHIVADLLSETINLPTDRTHPTTYEFVFPNPTDTFQFQMVSFITHNNNDNRGRVCIGNLSVYTSEGSF